jgi:hypothetical protein
MKPNWKKHWLEDGSGSWYSAKVPVIGWEYIVEDVSDEYWRAGLYLSKSDEEIAKISNKDYKTEKAAKDVCEKHLASTIKKVVKLARV